TMEYSAPRHSEFSLTPRGRQCLSGPRGTPADCDPNRWGVRGAAFAGFQRRVPDTESDNSRGAASTPDVRSLLALRFHPRSVHKRRPAPETSRLRASRTHASLT